jgi:hypothetical protein
MGFIKCELYHFRSAIARLNDIRLAFFSLGGIYFSAFARVMGRFV